MLLQVVLEAGQVTVAIRLFFVPGNLLLARKWCGKTKVLKILKNVSGLFGSALLNNSL